MSRHGYCSLVVLMLCASLAPAFGQGDSPPAPAGPDASAGTAPKEEPPQEAAAALVGMHVGYPAWDRSPYGNFLYFVPSPEPPSGILVLVHGSFDSDSLDGSETAKWYLDAFATAAQERNLVVVAPCFDDVNFGLQSKRPLGGYRRLYGRVVGADRFLESCVDRIVATFPQLDGKFLICGESSGGQFVSRYLVKHPDRIVAAVICRSQAYAMPSPDVRWPEGMARQQTMMRWEENQPYSAVDYTPDPKGWLKAAQLPVTVVVGALDTETIKAVEGVPGANVVERGRYYVQAMNEYARKQGTECKVRLVTVPNVGNRSLDLVPACIAALFARGPK